MERQRRSFTEEYKRQTVDRGMEAGSVVEALDEGEDIALGLGAGIVVAMMDQLGFQGMEEALHRGIVVAIGLAAH